MAKSKDRFDKKKVIDTLNRILEHELAGVIRYTHYSFLIFGHDRMPLVSWMRQQATESLTHAHEAGEHITTLGGRPSHKPSRFEVPAKYDLETLLRDVVQHETAAVKMYGKLMDLVAGTNVALEEYARGMVHQEELDVSEVSKMLRRTGEG